MDAPPNGPEEGLILPTADLLSRKRAILASAVDLLAAQGGTVDLDVAGASMIPTLPPGARIRVRLDPRRPRFGDTLLFVQGDSVVVHRYLGPAADRTGSPCLRTRGDGRHRLDPPLPSGDLLGRVLAVEREGGWRSLDGAGARAYGAAVALHDLFWAGLAHLARRSGSPGLLRAVERLDRISLKGADAALFRLLHPAPPGSGTARTPDAR